MSSRGRLSREQKGKAVASSPSPARDPDGTPIEDFDLIHREAMMDTVNLDLPQRVLVSDSARLHREETAAQARACPRDGQGGARSRSQGHVPICYYPGGIFEELPALSPELLRSAVVRGQSWGNVNSTTSCAGSVKILLRKYQGVGVTFLIPTPEQRPWSPPLGYQCVYESYFQDDTKLWFPIPRMVTAYARRRDGAISQMLNGSWRIAVALMVMAAEKNVTFSVRALEELTSINPQAEGLWVMKMLPNYNVLGGSLNKTTDWQRAYFFIKSDEFAFEDPPGDSYRVLWNAILGRLLILFSQRSCLYRRPCLFLLCLCRRSSDFSRVSGRVLRK